MENPHARFCPAKTKVRSESFRVSKSIDARMCGCTSAFKKTTCTVVAIININKKYVEFSHVRKHLKPSNPNNDDALMTPSHNSNDTHHRHHNANNNDSTNKNDNDNNIRLIIIMARTVDNNSIWKKHMHGVAQPKKKVRAELFRVSKALVQGFAAAQARFKKPHAQFWLV